MDVTTYDTDEPVVALLGAERDGVQSALPTAAQPIRPESRSELASMVEAERLDCVVLATVPDPPADPAAVVETVREQCADLPIVVVTTDPAPTLATELAAVAATHYLPGLAGSGDDTTMEHPTSDVLASVVTDAVETYDRRRQDARERAMFRELMEMAPLSIYVKDGTARNVAVSDVAEQAVEGTVLGKDDAELFGGDIGLDPDPEALPRSYRDDMQVLETGEPIENREERIEMAGDESLWLRTTKVPRRNDDGDVVGLLGVTRDVSAEKRRERELERESRRLEQFASFASHDLRNPLTVAAGNLELARTADDPATAEEYLDRVEDAIDRMEQLIADLLDIARPDEERDAVWTNLAAVADRAWEAVDAPEADLEIELPSDYEVRATSGALRQLLENVLGNAVEHGGTDVRVEIGPTATGFYVQDDGPGVPPEDREAVFEYGYTTGGSGIGLAITREIAEAHGWTVRATTSELLSSGEPSGFPTDGESSGDGGPSRDDDPPGNGEDAGARFEFDRCLTRRADAPSPVEGEPIGLGEWRIVGELAIDGGVTREASDRHDSGANAGDSPGSDDGSGGGSGVDDGSGDGSSADDGSSAYHGPDTDGTPTGRVTIRGGGRALWGDIEEYACLATDVDGDVRIEGRLLSVESVHDYSKAGLLLADATESGRVLGFLGKTAEHGTEAAWRSTADGPIDTHQAEPDAALPRWYRIDRLGDLVVLYGSNDGEDWTMVDQQVLALADPVAVGLAVNSHEAETACEATFETVRAVEIDEPADDR